MRSGVAAIRDIVSGYATLTFHAATVDMIPARVKLRSIQVA